MLTVKHLRFLRLTVGVRSILALRFSSLSIQHFATPMKPITSILQMVTLSLIHNVDDLQYKGVLVNPGGFSYHISNLY